MRLLVPSLPTCCPIPRGENWCAGIQGKVVVMCRVPSLGLQVTVFDLVGSPTCVSTCVAAAFSDKIPHGQYSLRLTSLYQIPQSLGELSARKDQAGRHLGVAVPPYVPKGRFNNLIRCVCAVIGVPTWFSSKFFMTHHRRYPFWGLAFVTVTLGLSSAQIPWESCPVYTNLALNTSQFYSSCGATQVCVCSSRVICEHAPM